MPSTTFCKHLLLAKKHCIHCPYSLKYVFIFAACRLPADVVFALDASGSIEKNNFFLLEEFIKDAMYGIDLDSMSRVGVLTFSDTADVRNQEFLLENVYFPVNYY